jgi:hypothetical protein
LRDLKVEPLKHMNMMWLETTHHNTLIEINLKRMHA